MTVFFFIKWDSHSQSQFPEHLFFLAFFLSCHSYNQNIFCNTVRFYICCNFSNNFCDRKFGSFRKKKFDIHWNSQKFTLKMLFSNFYHILPYFVFVELSIRWNLTKIINENVQTFGSQTLRTHIWYLLGVTWSGWKKASKNFNYIFIVKVIHICHLNFKC